MADTEFDGSTFAAGYASKNLCDKSKDRDAMESTQQPTREDAFSYLEVEKQARARIEAHCHFAGRGRLFEFHYSEEVLIVRGKVPTFYLKQVLQTVLKDLEGVRLIDNQVTVAACEGILGKLNDESPKSRFNIHN